MAVEGDAEHVVCFALVPVRAGPDGNQRWHMRVALLAADFQENPLLRFVIANIVSDFESIFLFHSVVAERVYDLHEAEFVFQPSSNAKNLLARNNCRFIAAHIDFSNGVRDSLILQT